MRFSVGSYVLAFALVALVSPLPLAGLPCAEARELQGRLGLGFNGQLPSSKVSGGVPGVAIKYALSRDLAFEAIAGLSTSTPSNTGFGAKFFKNIFLETNLNFYFTVGGGLVSGGGASGVALLAGFGTEFFIPGLESVGWSFEMGSSMDSLSGGFALKTYGASFIDAGMRFYF